MKPKIPLYDKRFKYVSAAKTDLADTFRRERKRVREEAKQKNEKIIQILRRKT